MCDIFNNKKLNPHASHSIFKLDACYKSLAYGEGFSEQATKIVSNLNCKLVLTVVFGLYVPTVSACSFYLSVPRQTACYGVGMQFNFTV
jgi:hypothetical protein